MNFNQLPEKTKGILLIIISALGFAIMSALVKLSGDLPSFQKAFFRNLVAVFVAGWLVHKHKGSYTGSKENWKLLFLRSFAGTLGVIFNFYAIDHLILSDANMLNKLSPLFVIIFSYIFLKEKIHKEQVLAIIIAFLGSLFIIKPTFSLEALPGISGILGAVTAGIAYTCVRALGKSEPYYTVVFVFSLLSCIMILPFAMFTYQPMEFIQLAYLLLAGVCASISQFCLTLAYKYAPAKEISIFDYTNVIFSAIISMILFNMLPDLLSIIGYAIIFAVAFYMYKFNQKVVD
ncbi:MAG: hypothetical protein ATN36_02050 [Epulopiscium sp. Nele67-Bin005]|nr:MAG: hypothetical protein ATN36_02050 [Epulopiscium sp. Nele67-Bin005]